MYYSYKYQNVLGKHTIYMYIFLAKKNVLYWDISAK